MHHAKPRETACTDRKTAARPASEIGIYLHFPWCQSKCRYCDFASVPLGPGRNICHERYAEQVLAELDCRLPHLGPHRLTTIFLGGGTPSLWDPRAIEQVMTGLLKRFDSSPQDVEITVECNPSSFNERTLEGLQAAKVNRVSLGIQSLDDNLLHFLGRRHDRVQALAALDLALKGGFRAVSGDLLFGLPDQSTASELAQVLEVVERGVSHLSVYALTIETNTPFGRLKAEGRLPLATDERVAEAFVAIHDSLAARGYSHYEISNYARPGFECLHNQQYWWGYPYLGLGAAAFGTVQHQGRWIRYRNPENISLYLNSDFRSQALSPFALPPDGSLEELEVLDAGMRLTERILLGLRVAEGVDLASLGDELGLPVLTVERQRRIDRQVARGNLVQEGPRLRIPPKAWLHSDSTILDIA